MGPHGPRLRGALRISRPGELRDERRRSGVVGLLRQSPWRAGLAPARRRAALNRHVRHWLGRQRSSRLRASGDQVALLTRSRRVGRRCRHGPARSQMPESSLAPTATSCSTAGTSATCRPRSSSDNKPTPTTCGGSKMRSSPKTGPATVSFETRCRTPHSPPANGGTRSDPSRPWRPPEPSTSSNQTHCGWAGSPRSCE